MGNDEKCSASQKSSKDDLEKTGINMIWKV